MARDVVTMYGPPGTGKTTAGLKEVEQALEQGTEPNRIAYVAFTRKAADEAANRAADRFGFKRSDLPHFRTLHSIAYRELGLQANEVLSGQTEWDRLSDALGFEFTTRYDQFSERVDLVSRSMGDRLLRCYALAKARQRSIEDEWRLGDYSDLPLSGAVSFARDLDQYKKERGLLDFTDFLDKCHASLGVDLFILDEAQDLTPQQWAFARRLAATASRVVLAGDDDQAIFEWAGSDSSRMRAFRGTSIVLPRSYRLPRTIHSLAQTVVSRIHARYPKEWAPRDDDGTVEFMSDWEHADLSTGQWLILGRHRRSLRRVERHLRSEGFVYQRENGTSSNHDSFVRAAVLYERLRKGEPLSEMDARLVTSNVLYMDGNPKGDKIFYNQLRWPWPSHNRPVWYEALTRLSVEDVEYVRALLHRGESLSKPGRISLSTVHGSKGGEADNVLFLADANLRTRRAAEENPDAETRVSYVAVTRARQRLYVVDRRGGFV